MKNFFAKISQGVVALSVIFATIAMAKVTIYMCGDSTMDTYPTDRYPLRGQGQDFRYWFDSTYVNVVNRGAAGYTLGGGVKDGKNVEGYYDKIFKENCSDFNGKYCVAPLLKPGDYVVIQFGINDYIFGSEEMFSAKMKQIVADIRAKGANPIIMSPISGCHFDSPTEIHNDYGTYPVLNQTLAQELNVPFIDMSEMTGNLMISVGEQYAQQFIYLFATTSEYSNLSDNLADAMHLQMNGANAYGRIITEQMRAHKDTVVKKLGEHMAPMYSVNVKVSPADAAEATSINAYYPEGMTVVLKTIPKSDKKFLGWYDGDGNKVNSPILDNVKSPYIYTFTMGHKSTQYTAVYEGGAAEKYTGDGSALKTFPTTTPKSLDEITDSKDTTNTTKIVLPQNANKATSGKASVNVYDMQGRLITNQKNSKIQRFVKRKSL